MKSIFMRHTVLALALIAGVAGSALSSDAVSSLSSGYEQTLTHHEITALIFKPGQPDAMNTFLTRVHAVTQADDNDGNGLYVLKSADRAAAMSFLQGYGKISRRFHIKMPQGEDGKSSAFSMWPNEKFGARLKASYLSSLKQMPPAVILDFSLKATLESTPASVIHYGLDQPRYVSEGSVLLPEKGALMSVRQTDNGFLIWLVSAE
ncbi:hypothetical protein [Erwinia persicina]|uniref:hypothetical protein n=1 Tax=Erwinia persicina TaxID=55211 RepID=UPI00178142ED|nr:hypothetical protein [Erwinia persicina]MBD8165369.1 hypothetical protein [Erwinia persicina]